MKKQTLALILFFATTSLFAQEIKYTTCINCWNPDSLGNHRAVIQYNGEGKIAKLNIPWRRRDLNPENKRIIIQDPQTQQRVLNVKIFTINREYGELYFQPTSGKGTYYLYYMPYKNEGRSNYPRGVYPKPDTTASQEWLNTVKDTKEIPTATTTEFQDIDSFNSVYPMEVIATEQERNAVIRTAPNAAYIVFPEDRMHPIKMTNDIPPRWAQKGALKNITDSVAKGENYTFQLGVWALQNVEDMEIKFSNLGFGHGRGSDILPSKIYSINTDGVAYDGKPFQSTINIPAGKVQSVWCCLDVPLKTPEGTYYGTATISAKGAEPTIIQISLTVTSQNLPNGGIDQPQKMTRLKWLNSTLAQENTVIQPYTPLEVNGNIISLLGRKVELNKDGFPKQIQTFFTPEMTGMTSKSNNLLTEGIHFHCTKKGDTKDVIWKNEGFDFTLQQPGTVQWQALNTSPDLQMIVNASLEFDGFASYSVKITALNDIELDNITMHIPFAKPQAKYMMGLGQKGGYRPQTFNWKWDVAHKNQDGAWIGDVNAGLQYSLRDENYIRPLNTNFYLSKPLILPSSWGNGTNGGINIEEKENSILADNYKIGRAHV